jgi:hypothetical protein
MFIIFYNLKEALKKYTKIQGDSKSIIAPKSYIYREEKEEELPLSLYEKVKLLEEKETKV